MTDQPPKNLSDSWSLFLSRWALASALVTLALVIMFIVFGSDPVDAVQGDEYSLLLLAARLPAIFKVAMLIDALTWTFRAGLIVALGMAIRQLTPLRSTLVALCGIAVLSGAFGGFIRLYGVSTLGEHYVQSPDLQSQLLTAFLVQEGVIVGLYMSSSLFLGLGSLLAAWSLNSVTTIPRWLTWCLVAFGVLSIVQAASNVIGFSPLVPFLLSNIAIGAALAVVLWRSAPAVVAASSAAS